MGHPSISVGTDLVFLPNFAEQLRQPGTRFARAFHPAELRRSASKPRPQEHLGGVWAAKEAFVKAFSGLRFGQEPVIKAERLSWPELEVFADPWGRPALRAHGQLAAALAESVGEWEASISISHDGDYATAVCVMRAWGFEPG